MYSEGTWLAVVNMFTVHRHYTCLYNILKHFLSKVVVMIARLYLCN